MSGKHLSRRQRRAGIVDSTTKVDDIPMVKPNYGSKPKAKTLFDIADERREVLLKQMDERSKTAVPGPNKDAENGQPGDEAILEAIMYGFTLSVVHFTFDALAQQQYGEEIDWKGTVGKLKVISPMILGMVYITHARPLVSYPRARQFMFLAGAICAGCYGLWLGNMEQYLAVQKKFPPVAVMCLWTVLEMRPVFNAIFLVIVASFGWWFNFSPW